MGLNYIGKNGAYVMGIPKRDLTEEDLEELAAKDCHPLKLFTALLVAGGCYEAPPKPKVRKPKEESE